MCWFTLGVWVEDKMMFINFVPKALSGIEIQDGGLSSSCQPCWISAPLRRQGRDWARMVQFGEVLDGRVSGAEGISLSVAYTLITFILRRF